LLQHDGKKFKLGTVVNGQHNHPAKSEAIRDALNILKEQACSENPPLVRDAIKLAHESVPTKSEFSTSTMGRCYRNYLKVCLNIFNQAIGLMGVSFLLSNF
jgi:hypothetical protein